MPSHSDDSTSVHLHGPAALLGVSGLVALLASTAAGAEGLSTLTPAVEMRGSIEAVREVLAPHRTEEAMIDFVGSVPTRCSEVGLGATICVFSLSNRQRGWRPLASVLETGDRLNLVCSFPAHGAPRAMDSCSVHSQRSNRDYYRRRLPGLKSRSRTPKSLTLQRKAELSADARELLAGARTAFELSTLVGDAPSHCQQGATSVSCTWKATAGTCGHGTLAISIDAPFRKKVRMSCRLPKDGSVRAANSCSVVIGG